jgi:hypothetical protein
MEDGGRAVVEMDNAGREGRAGPPYDEEEDEEAPCEKLYGLRPEDEDEDALGGRKVGGR